VTGYIDILLATYNGAAFLPEQLDSLFIQTCQNWRVLVWKGLFNPQSNGTLSSARSKRHWGLTMEVFHGVKDFFLYRDRRRAALVVQDKMFEPLGRQAAAFAERFSGQLAPSECEMLQAFRRFALKVSQAEAFDVEAQLLGIGQVDELCHAAEVGVRLAG